MTGGGVDASKRACEHASLAGLGPGLRRDDGLEGLVRVPNPNQRFCSPPLALFGGGVVLWPTLPDRLR